MRSKCILIARAITGNNREAVTLDLFTFSSAHKKITCSCVCMLIQKISFCATVLVRKIFLNFPSRTFVRNEENKWKILLFMLVKSLKQVKQVK